MDKNSVSLAGEFAVLSQLALQEIDANMTLGKTKGVDIIGYSGDNMFKLEVKTKRESDKPKSSKLFGKYCFSWPMNKKHEEGIYASADLFYCFVNIDEDKRFRYFIVPSIKVADYVKEEHQLWEDDKKHNPTDMREFRLGIKGEEYAVKSTLFAEDYENMWGLLKQSDK
jgi:hypothetical protein